MGTVGAAAQESPLRQIFSPVPSETTTDRGESASLGSFDINRLGEMLMGMMKENACKMDENALRMDAKMDANARRTDANIQDLE